MKFLFPWIPQNIFTTSSLLTVASVAANRAPNIYNKGIPICSLFNFYPNVHYTSRESLKFSVEFLLSGTIPYFR